MARIRKIVQSMAEDTRPAPPPNMQYLFRSARTAALWALLGLLAAVLTWAAMIGLWLWVTR